VSRPSQTVHAHVHAKLHARSYFKPVHVTWRRSYISGQWRIACTAWCATQKVLHSWPMTSYPIDMEKNDSSRCTHAGPLVAPD